MDGILVDTDQLIAAHQGQQGGQARDERATATVPSRENASLAHGRRHHRQFSHRASRPASAPTAHSGHRKHGCVTSANSWVVSSSRSVQRRALGRHAVALSGSGAECSGPHRHSAQASFFPMSRQRPLLIVQKRPQRSLSASFFALVSPEFHHGLRVVGCVHRVDSTTP